MMVCHSERREESALGLSFRTREEIVLIIPKMELIPDCGKLWAHSAVQFVYNRALVCIPQRTAMTLQMRRCLVCVLLILILTLPILAQISQSTSSETVEKD